MICSTIFKHHFQLPVKVWGCTYCYPGYSNCRSHECTWGAWTTKGEKFVSKMKHSFPDTKLRAVSTAFFLVPGWVEKNAYSMYTLVCWIHNGYILVVSIDKHIDYVFKNASFAIPFASCWASEGLTSSSELPLWSHELFCHLCEWDVTHISKTLPQNLMIWCDLVT